jgi:type II secretory pathway pseudopilin PulG
MKRPSARGFTLVELMIAAAIMMVAVAIAGTLIMAGVNLTRNATQRGDVSDQARMAMGELVKSIQNAGNGAPQGVWLAVGGTTPTLTGAVFGMDGTAGNGSSPAAAQTPPTDDLWVIVPNSNALRESCVDTGAATTIMKSGPGALKVGCVGTFAAGDLVLATNMNTAALLTLKAPVAGSPATVPGTMDFLESGTGISDSPDKGGFQLGDMVYKANVFHYSVHTDASGVYGLYRSGGILSGTAPSAVYPAGPYAQLGRPFIDDGNAVLVQANVDDLQIKYGFDVVGDGNPATFQWLDGLAAGIPTAGAAGATNASTLRALRVTIEVVSAQAQRDSDGHAVLTDDTRHGIIENNYTTGTQPVADGFMRTRYTRVIELANLAPGSL